MPPEIIGGTFTANAITLRGLLKFAYGEGRSLSYHEIAAAPDWIDRERFNVQAKFEGNLRELPLDQVRSMVRKLIEDRFQLQFHRENREMSVFHLVVAAGGPKGLKPSADQRPVARLMGESTASAPCRDSVSGCPLTVTSADIRTYLELVISLRMDRPVVDKTGLTGLYDLTYTSGFDVGVPRELGLRLEPGKEILEVVVIDSVQKPSPN